MRLPGTVAALIFLFAGALGMVGAVLSYLNAGYLDTPSDLFTGAPATVAGQVRDPDGKPVAGARVAVSDEGISVPTDGDGWYILRNIPPGEYTLTAYADGYVRSSRTVALVPGAPALTDFTLSTTREAALPEGTHLADTALDAGKGAYATAGLVQAAASVALLAAAAATLSGNRLLRMAVPVLAFAGIFSFGFGAGAALALLGLLLSLRALPGRKPVKS